MSGNIAGILVCRRMYRRDRAGSEIGIRLGPDPRFGVPRRDLYGGAPWLDKAGFMCFCPVAVDQEGCAYQEQPGSRRELDG